MKTIKFLFFPWGGGGGGGGVWSNVKIIPFPVCLMVTRKRCAVPGSSIYGQIFQCSNFPTKKRSTTIDASASNSYCCDLNRMYINGHLEMVYLSN